MNLQESWKKKVLCYVPYQIIRFIDKGYKITQRKIW